MHIGQVLELVQDWILLFRQHFRIDLCMMNYAKVSLLTKVNVFLLVKKARHSNSYIRAFLEKNCPKMP